MHFKVKLVQIGNSVGMILPKEVLAAMDAAKGDELTLTSAADGFRISQFDEAQMRQLEAARKIMKKRRHALRELAK
jgi:putative addiction module antidote